MLDELTFRRLEREYLQLTRLSAECAADGHMLLGALYANMGNRAKCTNHFDTALHLTQGQNLAIRCNESASCVKVGLFQRAANAIRATERMANTPEIFTLLLMDAEQCGMYATAHRLLTHLEKMKMASPFSLTTLIRSR